MTQCKKCGSQNINFNAKGFSQKKQKNFAGPRCNDCGAWNFELNQGNPPQTPQTPQSVGQNPPKNPNQMSKADWKAKDSSICALALCKVISMAGGYAKDITDTDHNKILELVYSDYIDLRNRETPLPEAEEVGF